MKRISFISLFTTFCFVSLVAATKECGKDIGSCPEGLCCSEYGYCGNTDGYCGKGCQSAFGTCHTVKKSSINVDAVEKSDSEDELPSIVGDDSDSEDELPSIDGNDSDSEEDTDSDSEEETPSIYVPEPEEPTEPIDDEPLPDEPIPDEPKRSNPEPTVSSSDPDPEPEPEPTVSSSDPDPEPTDDPKKVTITSTVTSVLPAPSAVPEEPATPINTTGKCTKIFGLVHKFNAFFFGDFNGFNSDVQGRIAAQGNIKLTSYQSGAYIHDPVVHVRKTNYACTESIVKSENMPYSIVAGGAVEYLNDGEINNGGVAYQTSVGLLKYITESIKSHKCSIDKKSVINFHKERETVVSVSTRVFGMKSNIVLKEESTKLVIDLVKGQNLYVITINNLAKFSEGIFINDNGVDIKNVTIIFNLHGEEISFTGFDTSALSKYSSNILWNALDAKKILIENFRIQGSLLAPNANIQGYSGNIQGQIIGKSFYGDLQIDWVPFLGCVE